MKRHLTGLSFSILAFFAGQAFVPSIPNVEEPDFSNRTEIVVAIPQTEVISELETVDDAALWRDAETYRPKIRLLNTGMRYQPDYIKAKNGETWLGLFKENNGYVLRPAKLRVSVTKIRMEDEYEGGDGLRKNVSVNGKDEPVFLLKNANKIREGKVNTLFRGYRYTEALKMDSNEPSRLITSFQRDFAYKYEIGGKVNELKVILAKNADSKEILALVLESDGKRQVLHTTYVNNGYLGDLYWVGDLDRDGKLDLYLSLEENVIVHNAVLFLSSEAEKGKLVKMAANFWTASGC